MPVKSLKRPLDGTMVCILPTASVAQILDDVFESWEYIQQMPKCAGGGMPMFEYRGYCHGIIFTIYHRTDHAGICDNWLEWWAATPSLVKFLNAADDN